MYRLTIQSTQLLSAALVSVSILETDDLGATHVLATAAAMSNDEPPGDARADLSDFLAKSMSAIGKALSTPQTDLDE